MITKEIENQIIKLYSLNISQREIGKILKINRQTIRKYLSKHKIHIKSSGEMNSLPINHYSFSKITSHEIAYWIGFLASDGNIYNNMIKLMLSTVDKDHILKFKQFLKSEHKILFNTNKIGSKIFTQCGISFRSNKICKDLAKHNIISNKSKTLQLSKKIPSKYISSYLLGIFDGDGCISISNNQANITLTSSKEVCYKVQNILIKKCGISQNKIKSYKKSPNTFALRYNGNKQVSRILQYLYSNSPIWLERKKQKYIQIFPM